VLVGGLVLIGGLVLLRVGQLSMGGRAAAGPVSAILDSSGDGNGGEHGVYHAVGGGALQFGLGP
jgi:hypothetical protein